MTLLQAYGRSSTSWDWDEVLASYEVVLLCFIVKARGLLV